MWKNERFGYFLCVCACWTGFEVWARVGRSSPPVRNNTVSPRQLFGILFQAAKTGMEAQMMKIAASPAALPKIDFEAYKRMLPGVAMIDDFQV